MKVVISADKNGTYFVEITEEQYKFWKWIERKLSGGNKLDDIEIYKVESVDYETIDE